MLCIWWDQRGILWAAEIIPKPSLMIVIDYNLYVWNKLWKKNDRNRSIGQYDKLILLHDNVRPHAAKQIEQYLERVKWTILPNPSYSLDIAPSNFHLFQSMQSALSRKRYNYYKGIKKWMGLMNGSLQKNQIFFLREICFTRKVGESSMEHILNELILFV